MTASSDAEPPWTWSDVADAFPALPGSGAAPLLAVAFVVNTR